MKRSRRRVTHDGDRRVDVRAVHRGEHERAGRLGMCSRPLMRHPRLQPGERRSRPARDHVVGDAADPARRRRGTSRGLASRAAAPTICSTTSSMRQPVVSTTVAPSAASQRAVGAARVAAVALDDRRLDLVDVAAELGDPALGADARRRGDEQLRARRRGRRPCRCHDPRSRRRRAHRPMLADGRRSSSRTGVLAATALTASVTSRPRIAAVASTPSTTHAVLADRQRRAVGAISATATSSVTGDARGAARRTRRRGTSHRCRGTRARGAGRGACRRCSCRRRPGRRWRSRAGPAGDRGHQDVPSGRPSS